MYILGVSCFYHDSAVALIRDGEIVAAAQEERFTRVKHDASLPINAINYAMKEADITADDLEAVAYYDSPLLTADRFLQNLRWNDEETAKGMLDQYYHKLFGHKIWISKELENAIGSLGKLGKLLVTKHHISHAASAFYPSPFENAAILTVDGVGEWTTTGLGYGSNEDLVMYEEIKYPDSIGLLYSAFTYFCGFKVNSGDYKFMGLAPYGKDTYYELIKDKIIDIRSDGSFRLNLEYFDYHRGGTMINEKRFEALFDGPRRQPESLITQREMDIAKSVQRIVEELLILIVKHLKELTNSNTDNLCMAGGVALNCVANGKIQKEKIFKNIWIQPAAGDAGGAIGCAYYAYYKYFRKARVTVVMDSQKGSYLGPDIDEESMKKYFDKNGIKYHDLTGEEDLLIRKIAELLADDKIVGIARGRMEFGPRALGNRSIIADCRKNTMQSKINLKIKYRESFRPFAPIVLEEESDKYFDLTSDSPYMLKVGLVNNCRCVDFDLDELLKRYDGDMTKVVSTPRSDIPAVTHVDYSARIQTLNRERNPFLYKLMKFYKELTGCAVLVNTSFNVRGEPIVCNYIDAYKCFMRTDMDVLLCGNCILYREEQPEFIDDNWRQEYALD
ncbi:MAG: hypothetical protein K5894_10750 [Lachnospiraceae bacterium]|nr:hypothetical protein [Lachnospiraceae bacterium]